MAAALHFLQVELGDKELSFTYDAPSAGLRGSSSFDPDSVLKSAQKVLDCLSPSKTNFLLENLERESKALTDKVLSSELTTALQEADPGSHLRIMLTPMLAWIPWELLWDGQQFLCQRFCMGRRFEQTPGEFDAACQRLKQPQTGRGALIALGDTRHLQPEEQKEGVSEILQNIFRVELLGKRKAEDLLQDLKDEYEVVHFIGHGTYKEGNAEEARSGWQCVDRILTAADIERVSSYKAFPLLIFANACDSAKASVQSAEGYVTDLYRAFLSKGVLHYIGTIARVRPEPSTSFVEVFYCELVGGASIGEALWKARQKFLNQPGPPIWAYYVHYGNPEQRLVSEERGLTPVTVEPPPPPRRRGRMWVTSAIASVLLLAIALIALFQWGRWYAYRFPADAFGVAILDFAIQNEVTGSQEKARILQADSIRWQLKTIRFPQPPEVRNIPRAFNDEGEALAYGTQTHSRIVVWGYGQKGKDTLELEVVLTPVVSRHQTLPVVPLQIGLAAGFRMHYRIDLANLKDLRTVEREVSSLVVLLSAIQYTVTGSQDKSLSADIGETFQSCAESPELSQDWRDACRIQLVYFHMFTGNTKLAEAIMERVMTTLDEEGEKVLAPLLVSTANLAGSLSLGFPTNDPRPTEETIVYGNVENRFLQDLVTAIAFVLNGDLRSARDLIQRALTEMSSSRGQVTLSHPEIVDKSEYAARCLLARIDQELGDYDEAIDLFQQLKSHRLHSMFESATPFKAYLGKYKETGDALFAAKALSVAGDSLDRAEIHDLQAENGQLLKELRKEGRRGDGTPAQLPLQLMNEGLRTGNQAYVSEAIATCEKRVTPTAILDPDNRPCLLLEADGPFFLGRRPESFDRYLNLWPLEQLELDSADAATVHDMRGYVAARRFGDYAAAAKQFEEADRLILDPWQYRLGNPRSFARSSHQKLRTAIDRAYVSLRKGDIQLGTKSLQWVCQHSERGKWMAPRALLAWAYSRSGKFAEAERTVSEAEILHGSRIHLSFPGTDRVLGLLYSQRGKLADAIEHYSLALRYDSPEDAERTWFYLADAYLKSHDSEKARECLSHLNGSLGIEGSTGKCSVSVPQRYADLGLPWEPRLCTDGHYLSRKIGEVEHGIAANPMSPDLHDQLFLLYRIGCDSGVTNCERNKEKTLLKEAARLDPRDSFNAPGLSRTPARRFIDVALLALDQGNSEEALTALHDCTAWYTGDPKSDLWGMEATALFDDLHSNIPRQDKFPPFYAPSLLWPRSFNPFL